MHARGIAELMRQLMQRSTASQGARQPVPDEPTDVQMQQLEQEKFLDDFRFARAFAKDKLRFSKWGSIKVKYHLKMKGISANIIREVFSDLDDIDQEEIIRKELEIKRKFIKDSDPYLVKMKLLRFAQSRGYDLDIVQRVVGL